MANEISQRGYLQTPTWCIPIETPPPPKGNSTPNPISYPKMADSNCSMAPGQPLSLTLPPTRLHPLVPQDTPKSITAGNTAAAIKSQEWRGARFVFEEGRQARAPPSRTEAREGSRGHGSDGVGCEAPRPPRVVGLGWGEGSGSVGGTRGEGS